MSWALAVWCAALALLSSGFAITRPSVVHALLWLVATLLALAACFFALGAGFAGALQILIYAGAITVVFVFVVMTVDAAPATLARERRRLREAWRSPALVIGLVTLPFLFGLHGVAGAPAPVSAKALGTLLFSDWAAAVELASFLLLAGLLGVRHIARRLGEAGE